MKTSVKTLVGPLAAILILSAGAAMAERGGMGHGPQGGMGGFGSMIDFATLDADGDGLLTQAEIEGAAAAAFAAADTDGDGGLSPDELLAQAQERMAQMMAARGEQMIERFDDNEDGLLQADEIGSRMPDAERMISRLDQDDDGAISQEEFDEAASRMRGHGDGERGGDRGGFMRGFGHDRHGNHDRDRG